MTTWKDGVAFATRYCAKEMMSRLAATNGIDVRLLGELNMKAVEKEFGSNEKSPKTVDWYTNKSNCNEAEKTERFVKEFGIKPVTKHIKNNQSNKKKGNNL